MSIWKPDSEMDEIRGQVRYGCITDSIVLVLIIVIITLPTLPTNQPSYPLSAPTTIHPTTQSRMPSVSWQTQDGGTEAS